MGSTRLGVELAQQRRGLVLAVRLGGEQRGRVVLLEHEHEVLAVGAERDVVDLAVGLRQDGLVAHRVAGDGDAVQQVVADAGDGHEAVLAEVGHRLEADVTVVVRGQLDLLGLAALQVAVGDVVAVALGEADLAVGRVDLASAVVVLHLAAVREEVQRVVVRRGVHQVVRVGDLGGLGVLGRADVRVDRQQLARVAVLDEDLVAGLGVEGRDGPLLLGAETAVVRLRAGEVSHAAGGRVVLGERGRDVAGERLVVLHVLHDRELRVVLVERRALHGTGTRTHAAEQRLLSVAEGDVLGAVDAAALAGLVDLGVDERQRALGAHAAAAEDDRLHLVLRRLGGLGGGLGGGRRRGTRGLRLLRGGGRVAVGARGEREAENRAGQGDEHTLLGHSVSLLDVKCAGAQNKPHGCAIKLYNNIILFNIQLINLVDTLIACMYNLVHE